MRNRVTHLVSTSFPQRQEQSVKSIILWLCGVPVVVIIGLKLFGIL